MSILNNDTQHKDSTGKGLLGMYVTIVRDIGFPAVIAGYLLFVLSDKLERLIIITSNLAALCAQALQVR